MNKRNSTERLTYTIEIDGQEPRLETNKTKIRSILSKLAKTGTLCSVYVDYEDASDIVGGTDDFESRGWYLDK